ncbi:hypothetical protein [Nocardia sp. NPDC005745]|uniref:hypothetical protein n=1 Tax=Nocardia sp. NPDC005745 TaxID=3157061 RepID=UPI00340FA7D5
MCRIASGKCWRHRCAPVSSPGTSPRLDPSDTAIALEAIFTAVIITVVQVGGNGSSERIDAVARLVRTALTGKRPT